MKLFQKMKKAGNEICKSYNIPWLPAFRYAGYR